MKCPRCGSDNTEKRKGVYADHNYCLDCKYKFFDKVQVITTGFVEVKISTRLLQKLIDKECITVENGVIVDVSE